MATFMFSFLLSLLIFTEISSKVVTKAKVGEIESDSVLSKEEAKRMLNDSLKFKVKKLLHERSKRSANTWVKYIIVSPYCIPEGVDCPCKGCRYCCKGKCNSSSRKPCKC